jgi:diaminobutyrate-2-oxoglutarate transaminase
MMRGINCVNGEIANKITREAFKRNMIIETSGADDQVVKLLCPLTITEINLKRGLDIIEASIKTVCQAQPNIPAPHDYFLAS